MVPLKNDGIVPGHLVFDDPGKLQAIDQRPEFWSRWATAKGLSLDPPEAMKEDALVDLTKEPLLAYLLILSGYASERWQEAAENRNRIYQAIFDQIWNRERTKTTRIHLNDLGQEGFEAIMQALGLAAWRGGGRTGDEATFTSVRDVFMRPDLLAKAKACGAADLSNVALLFYTRKDEDSGRGYEFLHKSFGEYLTARGLLNAFQRWGSQVDDATLDFDLTEFLRRWLRLAGPAPMTREVLNFLRNEARLQAWTIDPLCPWLPARRWVGIAERLVDAAVRDGLPAHERATKWRVAETCERNAEQSLMGLLDACARAAFPSHLRTAIPGDGGWEAGPVHIPAFEADDEAFGRFLARFLEVNQAASFAKEYGLIIGSSQMILQTISRLSLPGARLFGRSFLAADLEGTNFEGAIFIGAVFVHTNLSKSSVRRADFRSAAFSYVDLTHTDLGQATMLYGARIDDATLKSADLDSPSKRRVAREMILVRRPKARKVKRG
jgi:hypothetical protein